MIVLITGGRDYHNKRELFGILDDLHEERRFTFLMHGAARGADRLAHRWAKERGVQPVAFEALWDFEGDGSGSKRNARMLEFKTPDLVVAFSGGRGTANMMARAVKKEIPVIDVEDI